MKNQSTYRIRTKLGEIEPINIPINLMQEYNSFEILSLKMNVDENYNSYTSTEGLVVGRVSTANNGLGIPNVRVSIFVPKGQYSQTDEEAAIYPFSSPTDKDGDRVRYNLLPSESDVDCYQVIGTLPTKRKILDNETICEVFEKYYKYTTVTNEAGDFMLTNIPVGKQRIHIDADLSDIGPFLSQRPYDMIENLGFDKNKFDSTRQFKASKDLDSLAQVISQTKSVYVYPYWGDVTEHSSELKITRTDLSLNYEFKTSAIFIGSVITDKQSNSIRQNCTATENSGKMADMVTGSGRIEMIRKTVDDKIEQYRVKGDELINSNGVWCYMIPMNLDYVRTDEYGNIIPTDDPNKGVPTRARVRFRITLTQMDSDEDAHKRCSYLVPNNPKTTDKKFLAENDADYSFGSDTWDESFVDLFWNKVYSVKNYVPQIQKTTRSTNRKHTGIKMVNHYGDNNPFPYNGLTIKLTFTFRLICVIVKVIIAIITGINAILSVSGALPCWLANISIFGVKPFKGIMAFVPGCIELSSEFCDDGINKNVTYPGCIGCIWTENEKKECEKEQAEIAKNGGEAAVCTNKTNELITCIENELAQQNETTSFNFSNDWINGCLYMPLWYRHIRPKKSFFFGLFKRSAKDQWCSSDATFGDLKIAKFCAHSNTHKRSIKDYEGEKKDYFITQKSDDCGDDCHNSKTTVALYNGVIVNKENLYGQKVWYYKSVEVKASKNNVAAEYLNKDNVPMTSKTLYATDIILLGSMNDCDMNGIPKFYNYLKASTFNLPTDILFSDTEFNFTLDENGNWVSTTSYKTSVASGCDWGNENEYGYSDGGLFYSIGCSTIEVNTPSCINLRRICELGVGLDEMQYIENIETNINSETDQLDLGNIDYNMRPDGFISYDDIIDFNYRSMFATMNGNHLHTKMNKNTGIKEYDFRHLYIDNFDGSLQDFMSSRQQGEKNANYNKNYILENTNDDYLTFRLGDKPYYYDGTNGVGGEYQGRDYTFPKYENSFYFYFGLKEGKTAIDLFNEQYNAPCSAKSEEEEQIEYSKRPNSWCCVDSDDDNSYSHKSFDGYLTFNLEDISLPCSMVLNSRDNASVTYTVCKFGNIDDTNVTDEKICFSGSNPQDGYVRYGLIYENSSLMDVANKSDMCYMVNNGEYTLYITDGDGNQHSYVISIKNPYLEFDDTEKAFKQPNNVLLKYYKTTDGKYSSIPYNSVAKSPTGELITITTDENNVPIVERLDKSMTYVVNPQVISDKYIKLNGTICIYNVYYNNAKLQNYVIEVEPYDKDNDGNYVDEDFWKSADEPNKTWYEAKRMITGGEDRGPCIISERKGKKYVNEGGEQNYIYSQGEYFVIKCPKGGVDYKVIVTQICEDNGVWFKSSNYVEKKINVAEPTPYKFYINDVDYDVIRNFNTGYVLSDNGNLQTIDGSSTYGVLPFKVFGEDAENSSINKMHGWGEISNIQSKYYDWSVDESIYGPSSLTEEYTSEGIKELRNNVVDLEKWLETHGVDDAEYETKMDDYENKSTILQYLDNRLEFIDTVKSAFWLQCENEEKSITYSVRTDDTPYQVWSVYNEEEASSSDEDYNETKSVVGDTSRVKWYCKGEETTTISGIKIPTITSYDSADFGIANDTTRQTMTSTFIKDKNKAICFAQDNVAQNSTESGSVSIKPPYLVACVNNEGITKPDNLKKGEFFNENENSAGVTTYEFGDTNEKNNQRLRYGVYQFFGFHIIDKIFAPNIVCWSYINNVPYYVPWANYDEEQSSDNKLGYSIKADGILSGNINNGISSSTNDKGCVDDFEESNIFSRETSVKTYVVDTEDSIPTRRCILYDGDLVNSENEKSMVVNEDFTDSAFKYPFNKGDEIKYEAYEKLSKENQDKCSAKYNLTYTNYRHTTKARVENVDQYRTVPNRQGTLSFSDGSCETTRDLYGSMKIRLLSTTLNKNITAQDIISSIFNTKDGETEDLTVTLKVSCSNSDTDKPIKYYIFRASQQEELQGSQYISKLCWYPLNAFVPSIDEGNNKITYSIDCKCKDNEDETDWVWDGSTDKAAHFFNKNTLESNFRDPDLYKEGGQSGKTDLASYKVTSQSSYEDSEGEIKYETTYGYGTTGVFTGLLHQPYFVVAVTDNNCRAVSPVYDFHLVYYIVGLIENNNSYYLRTALVYVLRNANSRDDKEMDNNSEYGVGDTKSYFKKPRNYYLTQYDFTVNYTFGNGSSSVASGDITYEKKTLQFVKSKTDVESNENVGKSYYDERVNILYTNNGGSLVLNGEPTTDVKQPTISLGDYYFVSDGTKDDEGEYTNGTYQIIDSISESDGSFTTSKSTTRPISGTPITGEVYISYTSQTTDESGKTITVTYYVPYKYTNVSEENVSYDPRIPYFMRSNDKQLTKDENDALKTLLNRTPSSLDKSASFYVTDVTGLKHKCVCYDIIKNESEWASWMKLPLD